MDKLIVEKLHTTFEDCTQERDGVEFWFARDLQGLLKYDEWRNFLNVIDKAKVSCQTAGLSVTDHFVDVNKTIGDNLEQLRIVKQSRTVGNAKLFRLNQETPVVQQLIKLYDTILVQETVRG